MPTPLGREPNALTALTLVRSHGRSDAESAQERGAGISGNCSSSAHNDSRHLRAAIFVMKAQAETNSTGNSNSAVPRKASPLQNSTRARRACVAVVFVALYVLLDRSTVFFQMWTGISAWYPPSGLSLAMLIGFGGSYIPLIMLGGVISALTNYHQSLLSFNTIGANLAVPGGYWAAAYVLRRVLKIDWQLRSIRDVFRLLVRME